MTRPTRLGQYVLLRPLAVGGMGEVFLARERGGPAALERLVAVKLLLRNYCENPEFVRMFVEEARLVAGLRHPGIVEVYDLGEQDGQYYLAMEYIAGCNLRDILSVVRDPGRAALPLDLGCQMFADLALALAHAHAGGGDPSRALVHRDVTPSNIMVSDQGAVKLIDFGVARAASRASLTTPGVLKGKFGYMAPEYIGGGEYDHRADIFSLGVVFYETLARRRLFRGRSAAEVIQQVMARPIEPLDEVDPAIPPTLADVVGRALARNPEDRYPTAAAFAEALREVASLVPPDPDAPTLRAWIEQTFASDVAARRALTAEIMDIPFTLAGRPPLPPGPPAPGARAATARLSRSAAAAREGATQAAPVVEIPIHADVAGLSQSLHGQKVTASGRPPRRASAAILGIGAALLLVAGGAGFIISRSTSPGARPAAAKTRPEVDARTEAAAHRLLGLRAMQARAHETAVRELTEAVRLGDDEAAELLALATSALLEDRRRDVTEGVAPPHQATPAAAATGTPAVEVAAAPASAAAGERPRPARGRVARTANRRDVGPPPEEDAPLVAVAEEVAPPPVVEPITAPVVPREAVPAASPEPAPPVAPSTSPDSRPPVLLPPPPTPAPPPVAQRGTLCITSPNVFGEVYIDGQSHGYPPVKARKIPVGTARVEIRVDGVVRRSRQATVKAGAECTEVRFD